MRETVSSKAEEYGNPMNFNNEINPDNLEPSIYFLVAAAYLNQLIENNPDIADVEWTDEMDNTLWGCFNGTTSKVDAMCELLLGRASDACQELFEEDEEDDE